MTKKLLMRFSAGFSQAEITILIVLAVITAIFIPSILNTISTLQTKHTLQQSYKELNSISKSILVNQPDGTFKNLCESDDSQCIRNLFMLFYGQPISVCDNADDPACWAVGQSISNGSAAYANPQNEKIDNKPGQLACNANLPASFVTHGHTTLKFKYIDKTCKTSFNGIPVCGLIAIDINANKAPNKDGQDRFYFYMKEKRIIPAGNHRNHRQCNDSCRIGCAAAYLPAKT